MISTPPISLENCSYNEYYLLTESADSSLELRLEIPTLVTSQTKQKRKEELCSSIQNHLKQFKWISAGRVNIDITWYLNAMERQETDKIGDLDNLTKPILDSLTGKNGVFVDDSQIQSINTKWLSRNEKVPENILTLKIYFINDHCIFKKDLIFVQYEQATCLALNVDFNNTRDVLNALLLIKAETSRRKTATKMKKLDVNVDFRLVVTPWNFHRTRLGGFESSIIYTLQDFKEQCHQTGIACQVFSKLVLGITK